MLFQKITCIIWLFFSKISKSNWPNFNKLASKLYVFWKYQKYLWKNDIGLEDFITDKVGDRTEFVCDIFNIKNEKLFCKISHNEMTATQ